MQYSSIREQFEQNPSVSTKSKIPHPLVKYLGLASRVANQLPGVAPWFRPCIGVKLICLLAKYLMIY